MCGDKLRANATRARNLHILCAAPLPCLIRSRGLLTCLWHFVSLITIHHLISSLSPPLSPTPLSYRLQFEHALSSSMLSAHYIIVMCGAAAWRSRARGGLTPPSIQCGTGTAPVRVPQVKRRPSTRPATIATIHFKCCNERVCALFG